MVFSQVIGVLQVFPDLTNTEGKPLIYLPLGVIIAISMLKDFLEDNKRWKSDKEENYKKIDCLDANNAFNSKNWMDLQIGNIVKVMSFYIFLNILYFFKFFIKII